jgi:hypothetical protein
MRPRSKRWQCLGNFATPIANNTPNAKRLPSGRMIARAAVLFDEPVWFD